MALIPNGKLLLKMLGVIVLLFVIIIVISLVSNNTNVSNFGIVIPLGLFAFLVYKFGKKGLLSILVFLGGASLLFGIGELLLGNSALIIPAIIVFVVLIVPAFILGKLWNIPLTSLTSKKV